MSVSKNDLLFACITFMKFPAVAFQINIFRAWTISFPRNIYSHNSTINRSVLINNVIFYIMNQHPSNVVSVLLPPTEQWYSQHSDPLLPSNFSSNRTDKSRTISRWSALINAIISVPTLIKESERLCSFTQLIILLPIRPISLFHFILLKPDRFSLSIQFSSSIIV